MRISVLNPDARSLQSCKCVNILESLCGVFGA